MHLTDTQIAIVARDAVAELQDCARNKFIVTADAAVTATYSLGDNGRLRYVMAERHGAHNAYTDHWEHLLPAGGRQAFYGPDRHDIAKQLITQRIASIPDAFAAARAARRAAAH